MESEYLSDQRARYHNHLKIDVDGIENKIIEGGENVFKCRELRSVLIEINLQSDGSKHIINTLANYGFSIVKRTPANLSKKNDSSYNYIFLRE